MERTILQSRMHRRPRQLIELRTADSHSVVLQVDPSTQAACDDQNRLQGVEQVARLCMLAIDSQDVLRPVRGTEHPGPKLATKTKALGT